MPKGRASARAARAAKARMPKLVEDDKVLLGLRGSTSSPTSIAAMKDLVRAADPRVPASQRRCKHPR